MVLCFIALGVFVILSLFSAKYRPYAKEAFNCVIRKATFRKCDTALDLKIKAEIVGKLMGVNKTIAAITNKHFVLLSWIFTLLMIGSFVYSAVSVYNYVVYGNCEGPGSTGVCLFDLEATGEEGFSRCGEVGDINYPPSLEGHIQGNEAGELTIIEYGCFSCSYTQKSEETVKRILAEYGENIQFVYKNVPIGRHPYAWEAANAIECAAEQDRFLEYKDALFSNQAEFLTGGIPVLKNLAVGTVQDTERFDECVDSNDYLDKVNNTYSEAMSIGIYGTPTFFIGEQTFVGNVDYNTLKNAIEEELNK